MAESVDSSIDTLFQQILDAEEKALMRQSRIKEVKSEISNLQEKIMNIIIQRENLNKMNLKKLKDLSEEELNLKCVAGKEELLSQRCDTVEQEIQNYKTQVANMKADVASKQEKLCSDCSNFTQEFSLMNDVDSDRQTKKLEKVEKLKQQIHNLKKGELAVLQLEKENLQRLRQQKTEAMSKLSTVQNQVKELRDQLRSVMNATVDLEKEKEILEKLPQTDAEFVRLRKEIESYNIPEKRAESNRLWQRLQHIQKQQWNTTIARRPTTTQIQPRNSLPPNQDLAEEFGNFELMEEFLNESF